MAVCLLIVHLPKMHKHVHELLGISKALLDQD